MIAPIVQDEPGSAPDDDVSVTVAELQNDCFSLGRRRLTRHIGQANACASCSS